MTAEIGNLGSRGRPGEPDLALERHLFLAFLATRVWQGPFPLQFGRAWVVPTERDLVKGFEDFGVKVNPTKC